MSSFKLFFALDKVFLAMVAVASANFMCCPGERNIDQKEVKKISRSAFMPPNDFPAYTPTAGSKSVFAKPPSSHTMPAGHLSGNTATLIAKSEIAPVDTTDSFRGPSALEGSRIPVPMSPPRVFVPETNNRSPTRDTENIPTTGSSSVPTETRSRSPVPRVPMRSHNSNTQVNESNNKPIARVCSIPPSPPF